MSLYRCPKCQTIHTGKQWHKTTLSRTGKSPELERHYPGTKYICPACHNEISNEKIITIWEFGKVS